MTKFETTLFSIIQHYIKKMNTSIVSLTYVPSTTVTDVDDFTGETYTEETNPEVNVIVSKEWKSNRKNYLTLTRLENTLYKKFDGLVINIDF